MNEVVEARGPIGRVGVNVVLAVERVVEGNTRVRNRGARVQEARVNGRRGVKVKDMGSIVEVEVVEVVVIEEARVAEAKTLTQVNEVVVAKAIWLMLVKEVI